MSDIQQESFCDCVKGVSICLNCVTSYSLEVIENLLKENEELKKRKKIDAEIIQLLCRRN